MKKIVFALMLLFTLTSAANAQSLITDSDWEKVIAYLKNEDWGKANQLSKVYLEKIPKDQANSDEAAILRYMYALSESGLMNAGKITQDQALKNVKDFVGLNIILPGHPITLKTGFNSLEMANDKPDTLLVTATNKAADEILCFEYIVLDKPFTMAEFKDNEGKVCRVRGRLKSIRVDGHSFPRYRMIIDQGATTLDK
jgi:hypothetical protein